MHSLLALVDLGEERLEDLALEPVLRAFGWDLLDERVDALV